MYIVSPHGDSPYSTLQSALDAIPENAQEPALILVREGEYREKVHIVKPNVRIVGESRERTRLVFSDFADQRYDDGTIKGTFCSYTLLVDSDDVTLENLTICNDAGPGAIVGQALALYGAGDRLTLRNCHLWAHQDTVYLGPLLDKVAQNALPYVLMGRRGEIDADTPQDGRAYFENCTIAGDVDFIFGPYRAWFERCVIRSLPRVTDASDINGYITAANTPSCHPFGFVFHRCALHGEGCPDGSVYLGRPWREGASVYYLRCTMDASIHPLGFCDWANPHRAVTARCGEYASEGLGAAPAQRHAAQAQLTDAQAKEITLSHVLEGWAADVPAPVTYFCTDAPPAPSAGTKVLFLPGASLERFVCDGDFGHLAHFLRAGDTLHCHFGKSDTDPRYACTAERFSLCLQLLQEIATAHHVTLRTT